MRFEELRLEKYGVFDARALSFAGRPGLAVIYGPNEAGKSTCLAAITDFLFGIPQSSGYGRIYGYDQMRLSATLRMADGRLWPLRRRKGRAGRTLTDAAGQPVDEGALAAAIGATTRERFEALFGLDHKRLRDGGDRLLKSDGDIGRLIVEAGGGLRTLIETLDAVGRDAESLFSPRRSADRAFYKVVDAFKAADGAVKDGLVTRDAFDRARQDHERAAAVLDKRREDRAQRVAQAARERRLLRVLPKIVEIERIDEELARYQDLPALRDEFAETATRTLSAHESAAAALREADEKLAALKARVDAVIVPTALVEAEALIADIAERAGHVAKARDDRPNRERERAVTEEKLAALRHGAGIADGVALEDRLPSRAAIERVQALARDGLMLVSKLDNLRAQIADDTGTVDRLDARQATRRALGQDLTFGTAPSELAPLAGLVRALEGRRAQARRLESEVAADLRVLSFEDEASLRSFACPDAAVIQAEIERRAMLAADLLKHEAAVDAQATNREAAAAGMAGLAAGGEVPSAAAIDAARRSRDALWVSIRRVYVESVGGPDGRPPPERGLRDATDLEAGITQADALADRRFMEAHRVATLDRLSQQQAEAQAALKAASAAKDEAEARIAAAARLWMQTWPDAIAREPDPGRLKALVERRAVVLARADALAALRGESELAEADVTPRLELLETAEARLGLAVTPGVSLVSRVQTVAQRIAAHDEGHADWRRDEAEREVLAPRLKRRRDELVAQESSHTRWRDDWAGAVAAIGLERDASPERAGVVATLWAAASGNLDALAITRQRLEGMDEDERDLRGLIARAAPAVELALPQDVVAAAHMLRDRSIAAGKAAAERRDLARRHGEQAVERASRCQAVERAAADVATLCAEAGCEPGQLAAVADRAGRRAELDRRRRQALDTVASAGDGLALDTLRRDLGGRDLDAIGAAVARIEAEIADLDPSIDQAVAALRDCERDLEGIMSLSGMNRAVAERESAAAELHRIVERHVELALAHELLSTAIHGIRAEQQDPLIARAGALFAAATRGTFAAIETDVDGDGTPVVMGRRATGATVPVDAMSDGTRDQLFLAFRLASVEHYCAAAEPLPFIGDDLLVHFDDERSRATLDLLAEVGRTTQVLLFTHHRSVCEAAAGVVARGLASVLDLGGS